MSSIADFPKLKLLSLRKNAIKDITPLTKGNNLGEKVTGTRIDLRENHLDLSPGSEDKKDLEELGYKVMVLDYEPQK